MYFLLTAPTRTAMQLMLDTASSFAAQVGWSSALTLTELSPRARLSLWWGQDLAKPAPLMLCGRPLPWVSQASHLGHEFSKDGRMQTNTKMRHGAFIGRCLEVQEAFSFAAPSEVLRAIKLYCSGLYGGMLSRLYCLAATRLTKCWNIAVKDLWGLLRSANMVYVRWLSAGHTSLKEDLAA